MCSKWATTSRKWWKNVRWDKNEFLAKFYQKISKILGVKISKKVEIYNKTRQIVKLSSHYVYLVYIKILLPFSTAPFLITSYYKYYFTDLGRDAFDLPFLFWYET